MKIAFLTESNYQGKVPTNHPNARTEITWQAALNSDHFNIHNYEQVKDYDVVFIIFPKATVKLNMVGCEMTIPGIDNDISIYSKPIVSTLKLNNKKICFIQEGPHHLFNDYSVLNQFNYYNQLAECDILFAHNEYDVKFYKGLFPQTKVAVIPTLMFPIDIIPIKEDKAIISGNMATWYGGFQSYIVASEFNCPVFVPSSHCKRVGEEQIPNLHHLPWVMWNEWMKNLSSFKYAVSMMPIIAAGTFAANCAYFKIPCIGNVNVDTQHLLFPNLSININDINAARIMANQLKNDIDYYNDIADYAKNKLHNSVHMDIKKWLDHMESILENKIS